jgi:hypothetical protein
MTVDEQLLYESRVRTRQAIVAALAGILLVGAAAVQLSGPQSKINELTIGLITIHKRYPIDLIGSVINAFGLIGVAWTLSFLVDIARARNPDLRSFIRWVAIVGGAAAAITGIAYAVLVAAKADQFVTQGNQTYQEANHLTSTAGFFVVPLIGQAAALLLAVAFVLTALNAMRVGLLTRFMGYLGIFTGVLVMFPIGSPVPVVQGFWLLSLAYLISGRWPTGVPPAWRSGKAEKWPSSQEMREQRASRPVRGGAGRAKPTPKPAPAEPVGAPGAARTRASTPKRKRKRRH